MKHCLGLPGCMYTSSFCTSRKWTGQSGCPQMWPPGGPWWLLWSDSYASPSAHRLPFPVGFIFSHFQYEREHVSIIYNWLSLTSAVIFAMRSGLTFPHSTFLLRLGFFASLRLEIRLRTRFLYFISVFLNSKKIRASWSRKCVWNLASC